VCRYVLSKPHSCRVHAGYKQYETSLSVFKPEKYF
jgi:hypothetical protein